MRACVRVCLTLLVFEEEEKIFRFVMTIKITRTCSRLGAIANPHTKVIYPPHPLQHPKSHPWGMPPATEGHSVQCVFYVLFVGTHTKFGIKIFKIDMVTEIELYLTF